MTKNPLLLSCTDPKSLFPFPHTSSFVNRIRAEASSKSIVSTTPTTRGSMTTTGKMAAARRNELMASTAVFVSSTWVYASPQAR